MDERMVEALTRLSYMIQSKNSAVRHAAAVSLGKINLPEARGMLVQLLKDSEKNVLAAALYSLGKIGDAKAAHILVPYYNHEDTGLRRVSLAATKELLERIPSAQEIVFAPLITLLFGLDDVVRADAVAVLSVMKDERSLEPLLSVTTDENKRVRANAIEALSFYTDERAKDAVVNACKDSEFLVRVAALQGLATLASLPAYVNDKEFVEEIYKLTLKGLEDENDDVRSTAVWSLGHLDTDLLSDEQRAQHRSVLKKSLYDDYPWVVRYALDSLVFMGTPWARYTVEQFAARYPEPEAENDDTTSEGLDRQTKAVLNQALLELRRISPTPDL